jgi:hypothetical protein
MCAALRGNTSRWRWPEMEVTSFSLDISGTARIWGEEEFDCFRPEWEIGTESMCTQ